MIFYESLPNKPPTTEFTTPSTTPKRRAYQNPSTWKLSPIIALANKIITAVITKEKSPSVKTLIGKLKIDKIGRTIAFNNPMTIATIIALPYPLIATPGMMLASAKTTNAEIKRLIIKFIIVWFLFE